MNKNPRLKGQPTAASSVPGLSLAWLPGSSPPWAPVLEGGRQKLESWLIKAN